MIEHTGPVTVAASRRVSAGRETDFAVWADGICAAAEQFPGHLGAGYIRPAETGGEHTIVYRFDTPAHFDAWQNSAERTRWIEKSRDLIEGEPRLEKATGLEFWFHDPACSYGTPPPVWKQAILTEVGLYPTVLFVAYTVGLLVTRWPLPLRSLVTSMLSVTLMTLVVMPAVSRAFKGWLRSKPKT